MSSDDRTAEVCSELPNLLRINLVHQVAFGHHKELRLVAEVRWAKPDRRVGWLCSCVLFGLLDCRQRRVSDNCKGQFQLGGSKPQVDSEGRLWTQPRIRVIEIHQGGCKSRMFAGTSRIPDDLVSRSGEVRRHFDQISGVSPRHPGLQDVSCELLDLLDGCLPPGWIEELSSERFDQIGVAQPSCPPEHALTMLANREGHAPELVALRERSSRRVFIEPGLLP